MLCYECSLWRVLLIEYLAPEFIFNMGHDSSSDLWALGVLIYEMILSGTPFAAKRPDNVSELFANIANVKVCCIMMNYLLGSVMW